MCRCRGFQNSERFTNEGGYLDHPPGDSDASDWYTVAKIIARTCYIKSFIEKLLWSY
jgi:hypothetical protein